MTNKVYNEIEKLYNNYFDFELAKIEKISERFLEPRFVKQKSFYKRATIIESENCYYLKSYDTVVCGIVKFTGEFFRFDWWTIVIKGNPYSIFGQWSESIDWSPTTGKHIRDFTFQFLDLPFYKADVMRIEPLF